MQPVTVLVDNLQASLSMLYQRQGNRTYTFPHSDHSNCQSLHHTASHHVELMSIDVAVRDHVLEDLDDITCVYEHTTDKYVRLNGLAAS